MANSRMALICRVCRKKDGFAKERVALAKYYPSTSWCVDDVKKDLVKRLNDFFDKHWECIEEVDYPEGLGVIELSYDADADWYQSKRINK